MVDVFTEIQIACPRNKTAKYAANPDNAPEWYVNIKSAEWKTPEPLSMGSQIAFIAHFLGRRLEYVYEVTEFIPTQKLVMQTSNGPFPMETTYNWETFEGEHTRMTLRNRGNPSGFSKLFAPFMESAMRRANKKDLARLKIILEKQAESIR